MISAVDMLLQKWLLRFSDGAVDFKSYCSVLTNLCRYRIPTKKVHFIIVWQKISIADPQ